ncbi:MAG: hypothetical protein A2070_09145 [Bdellovibrionales bacterium GWC1_52_8]|nr:MAG: hypothetical protein A2070_09145 [Bdellovibrionales bacterium GWC1_52_8]
MKFRILTGLVLCNLIWSAHPVMFKIILGQFSAPESALLRYGSALIAFVLVWLIFNLQKPFALVFSRSGFWSMLTLGALTFCIAPMLQMVGIDKSRATDGSLITALEPLTAVLLARIFLRERLGLSNVLSIGLALAGFVLLSEFSIDARAAGNLLILASCVLEGAYSVLGRKLLEKHGLVPLFGSSLLLGVVALLVTVTILSESGGGGGGFRIRSSLGGSFMANHRCGNLGGACRNLCCLFFLADCTEAGPGCQCCGDSFYSAASGSPVGELVYGRSAQPDADCGCHLDSALPNSPCSYIES